MTSRWPSSCLSAVSSIKTQHYATFQVTLARSQPGYTRQYAQQYRPVQQQSRPSRPAGGVVAPRLPVTDTEYSCKAAFTLIEAQSRIDPVNPPRSVLPPPLDLPERAEASTIFVYLFRIGRAYGGFYKEGVKAVWYNYKAAKVLRERITMGAGARDAVDAAAKDLVTRAEWQLLARNDHDIGKLPFFGVLVLIFGEWLPLFVPFMPGVVPGTCRIPKQVQDMGQKLEERRRASFRQGISEPSMEQLQKAPAVSDVGAEGKHPEWSLADGEYVRGMLKTLRDDQLHHLSSTLGLHNSLWDRVQLAPPSFLLRRSLTRRLQYLGIDDRLLIRGGGPAKLNSDELSIACKERGIDVLGKKDSELRDSLRWWLDRQKEDAGSGGAVLAMLFRRPNAWKSKA